LGQPVVAENKTGADGNIGAAFVASAPPDGYTLLVGATSIGSINVLLHKNIKYDPQRDFVGITNLISVPNVLVVGSHVPAKNLKELLALQKQKSFNFGSSGAGGSMHLSGEIYKKMAGVEMVHVPYKGGGAAMLDVIGNRVTVYYSALPSAAKQIRAGKLIPLALTGDKRVDIFPEIPTIAESGLPGYEAEGWWAILGPRNLSAQVREKLNKGINTSLAATEVVDRIVKVGAAPAPSTPESLRNFINGESTKWVKVLKEARIELK